MLEIRASRLDIKGPKEFLSKLDANLKLKRRSNGYYIFPGGALSPTYASPVDSRSLEIVFRFKDSRAGFLDQVVERALNIRSICRMNFALRSDVIDFEAIRQRLILDNPSNESENFGGEFKDPRHSTRISAYPKLKLITIVSEFVGDCLKPSEIITSLLREDGDRGWSG